VPGIYQARCSNCDYESSLFPEGYGAVLIDEAASATGGTEGRHGGVFVARTVVATSKRYEFPACVAAAARLK